jgi:hypothetical protein
LSANWSPICALFALADALLAPGILQPEGAAAHRDFALAELRRGPLGLTRLVRDARFSRYCNTLIFVDQFEELFRYCREPAREDQANVFDAMTGDSRPRMRGHDGWITGVDFSRDDRFLVSASEDTTARVWEVATGIQVAEATTNVDDLIGAVFSQDGSSLLIFSPDRLLQWRCHACGDLNGLLGEVQRRQIVRALSPEEKSRYGLEVFEPGPTQPDLPRHAHQPRAPRQ